MLNRQISIDGFKLLMNIEKVSSILDKKYNEDEQFTERDEFYGKDFNIRVSKDRYYKNELVEIETSNPKHEVLGIHPKDTYEKALTILKRNGFKPYYNEDSSPVCFIRGYAIISLGQRVGNEKLVDRITVQAHPRVYQARYH